MNDNMKDNILNTGGDPPGTGGIDFSKMSDEELMKMEGSFSSSSFVKEITGTDNVCERSAAAAAGVNYKLVVKEYYNEFLFLTHKNAFVIEF